MGDYDLTAFGPWYGDLYSDIDQTIESIKPPEKHSGHTWLTGHENRVVFPTAGNTLDRYEKIIHERRTDC